MASSGDVDAERATGSGGALATVDRSMAGVSTALMALGCLLVTGVMLWIVASIVARGFEGVTVRGTPEVAANGVVAITLLCAPYVIRRGGHIRTGVLIDRLRPAGQRVAGVVAGVVGMAVFAFLAWATWEPMLTSWATGEYSGEGSLRIPTGPLRTIVFVFSVVMLVELLLATWKQARTDVAGSGEEETS